MLNIVDNIVGSKTLILFSSTLQQIVHVLLYVDLFNREQKSDFAYLLSKLFIELVFAVVYELENITQLHRISHIYILFFSMSTSTPDQI